MGQSARRPLPVANVPTEMSAEELLRRLLADERGLWATGRNG
jgi:replicative DNA helicase